MTLADSFRKPRCDKTVTIDSTEGLLDFIQQRRQNHSSLFTDDAVDSFQNAVPRTEADDFGDDVHRVENQNEITDEIRDLDDDFEEGISMLEPHIAAFRKRMDEDAQSLGQDTGRRAREIDADNDACEENASLASSIPLQLLRVVRYFPFKWIPMKRALLRAPSQNEVGKYTRLSLAKALYRKQFIALAEFDILQNSFHVDRKDQDEEDKDHNDSYETVSSSVSTNAKSRKRRRYQKDLSNDFKIAFSRLPLDRGNPNAMRHLKRVLNDYCNELNRTKDIREEDSMVISPDELAEWALLSFCGVVVANGLDEPISASSEEYSLELQIVTLLTSEDSVNKIFVNAIKRRIQVMLEPPYVDKLTNLNILCLARFISYLEVAVVELLFSQVMVKNFHYGCGSGFSSIPKILAACFSIMLKRNANMSLPSFSSNIKGLVARPSLTTDERKRYTDLAGAMFLVAEDLLRNISCP